MLDTTLHEGIAMLPSLWASNEIAQSTRNVLSPLHLNLDNFEECATEVSGSLTSNNESSVFQDPLFLSPCSFVDKSTGTKSLNLSHCYSDSSSSDVVSGRAEASPSHDTLRTSFKRKRSYSTSSFDGQYKRQHSSLSESRDSESGFSSDTDMRFIKIEDVSPLTKADSSERLSDSLSPLSNLRSPELNIFDKSVAPWKSTCYAPSVFCPTYNCKKSTETFSVPQSEPLDLTKTENNCSNVSFSNSDVSPNSVRRVSEKKISLDLMIRTKNVTTDCSYTPAHKSKSQHRYLCRKANLCSSSNSNDVRKHSSAISSNNPINSERQSNTYSDSENNAYSQSQVPPSDDDDLASLCLQEFFQTWRDESPPNPTLTVVTEDTVSRLEGSTSVIVAIPTDPISLPETVVLSLTSENQDTIEDFNSEIIHPLTSTVVEDNWTSQAVINSDTITNVISVSIDNNNISTQIPDLGNPSKTTSTYTQTETPMDKYVIPVHKTLSAPPPLIPYSQIYDDSQSLESSDFTSNVKANEKLSMPLIGGELELPPITQEDGEVEKTTEEDKEETTRSENESNVLESKPLPTQNEITEPDTESAACCTDNDAECATIDEQENEHSKKSVSDIVQKIQKPTLPQNATVMYARYFGLDETSFCSFLSRPSVAAQSGSPLLPVRSQTPSARTPSKIQPRRRHSMHSVATSASPDWSFAPRVLRSNQRQVSNVTPQEVPEASTMLNFEEETSPVIQFDDFSHACSLTMSNKNGPCQDSNKILRKKPSAHGNYTKKGRPRTRKGRKKTLKAAYALPKVSDVQEIESNGSELDSESFYLKREREKMLKYDSWLEQRRLLYAALLPNVPLKGSENMQPRVMLERNPILDELAKSFRKFSDEMEESNDTTN